MWIINWYEKGEDTSGSWSLSWFSRFVVVVTDAVGSIKWRRGIPNNSRNALLNRKGKYSRKNFKYGKNDYYNQGY